MGLSLVVQTECCLLGLGELGRDERSAGLGGLSHRIDGFNAALINSDSGHPDRTGDGSHGKTGIGGVAEDVGEDVLGDAQLVGLVVSGSEGVVDEGLPVLGDHSHLGEGGGVLGGGPSVSVEFVGQLGWCGRGRVGGPGVEGSPGPVVVGGAPDADGDLDVGVGKNSAV